MLRDSSPGTCGMFLFNYLRLVQRPYLRSWSIFPPSTPVILHPYQFLSKIQSNMHVTSFLSLFALQACIGWAINIQVDLIKRSVEQNATLYAYGGTYSAWSIAFGRDDGIYTMTQYLSLLILHANTL